MEWQLKHWRELTRDELYDLLAVRTAVFVVEQRCPYQEVDRADREAYHVWLRSQAGIEAYLRVLPRGVTFPDVSIGRVIAVRRRQGLGSRILAEGMRVARERLGAGRIVLEAQVYARGLYEKAGFRACSQEFLEDGIPHIKMVWEEGEVHGAADKDN